MSFLIDQILKSIGQFRVKHIIHGGMQGKAMLPFEGYGSVLCEIQKIGKGAEASDLERIITRSDVGEADDVRYFQLVHRPVIDAAGFMLIKNAMTLQEEDRFAVIELFFLNNDVTIGGGDASFRKWLRNGLKIGARNDPEFHRRPPSDYCRQYSTEER